MIMSSFVPALKRLFRKGPDVSFIVPIYNKARFLKECLESIAKQTFKDFEVICIDDCSSDDSSIIAREFAKSDRRFKFYQSKKRLGAGLARNKAMGLASGEFLHFVDADDILPANSTAILYRLVCTGEVKIARGGIAYFDKKSITSITHSNLPPDARSYSFADEPRLWTPWYHTSCLISHKMLRQHNICYPNLTDGEDPVFLARVLTTANKLSSTKEIVYFYRWGFDKPRTEIWDTIAHLETVREIYLQYEPKCWFEGYGNYMINEEIPRRLRQMDLAPHEEKAVTARLKEMMKPLAGE